MIQRRLDNSARAKDIAEYLLETPDRFFGSLVVGVMGGAPSWHPFSLSARRTGHDLGKIVERDQELVGYLELRGDEHLFALDGQHRLAGIKKAVADEPALAREQVSVLFVGHKTSEIGFQRTRSLFIALNKKAVPVQRRDIIVLDEVDLPALVTRRLVDEHPWFSRGQVAVERFTTSIPANSEEWTTIGNFYDVIAIAIEKVMAREEATELRKARRVRLSEERLDHYRELTIDFFSRLSDLDPMLKDAFTDPSKGLVPASRLSSHPRLLFRPIGLKIITKVLAALRKRRSLDASFALVARLPLLMSAEPFRNIIWDEARDRMVVRGESLATRLALHMLGVREGDDWLARAYAEWFNIDLADVRLPRLLE